MKNKMIIFGSLGAGFAALCCFTPLAVLGLAALGLAGLTAYLDYILLPLLLLCIGLLTLGLYSRKKLKAGAECRVPKVPQP